MSYACIYVPELSLTSKTRENLQGPLGISGGPSQTQCLATPTKILFGTIQHIQPRSIVSKHQQPQTTSISKKNANQPKQDVVLNCFEAFNPRLVSRVITGPSRFRHRFGKACGFPHAQGLRVQTQGFCSKIMGCHGSRASIKNEKIIRQGVTNPRNSNEVGILAAWAGPPASLNRFYRKTA
jgi:hypothetical protein